MSVDTYEEHGRERIFIATHISSRIRRVHAYNFIHSGSSSDSNSDKNAREREREFAWEREREKKKRHMKPNGREFNNNPI